MDAQTQAWIDQQAAALTAQIRRNGWAIQYVMGGICNCSDHQFADESADRLADRSADESADELADRLADRSADDYPSFAYTIGMFGMGHPELLVFGVDQATAHGVLNTLGERIRSGETLLPGQLIVFDEWPHRIIAEEVPNPGEIVFGANDFYLRPDEFSVPVLQLSYDDLEGRFPWVDGYTAPELQPRPGTFRA